MKDIVSKFGKPRHVVDVPCGRTSVTAKVFMMLPRHRRLIGCEIETDCYNQSYIYVVETFSRQGVNENSDNT